MLTTTVHRLFSFNTLKFILVNSSYIERIPNQLNSEDYKGNIILRIMWTTLYVFYVTMSFIFSCNVIYFSFEERHAFEYDNFAI